MIAHDSKELGRMIKSKENTIEVEGDLAKKVIRVKATGPVAWVIAVGAIGVAIVGLSTATVTGPVGPAVSQIVAVPAAAASFGGVSTSAVAVGVAVAGGGVGALNSLYHNYTVKKVSSDHIELHRKR